MRPSREFSVFSRVEDERNPCHDGGDRVSMSSHVKAWFLATTLLATGVSSAHAAPLDSGSMIAQAPPQTDQDREKKRLQRPGQQTSPHPQGQPPSPQQGQEQSPPRAQERQAQPPTSQQRQVQPPPSQQQPTPGQ